MLDLFQLQEEETISVDVLQQAVLWHEDLNLLVLPSLKWTGENTGCIESNQVKRYVHLINVLQLKRNMY